MSRASKERRKAARKIELAKPAVKPAPAPAAPSNGPRPHAPAGTRVAIIREAHGWHDGRVTGVLVDDHGTVRADDDDPDYSGLTFECEHRRDYRVIS